jgi:hypothetical protein
MNFLMSSPVFTSINVHILPLLENGERPRDGTACFAG